MRLWLKQLRHCGFCIKKMDSYQVCVNAAHSAPAVFLFDTGGFCDIII